MIKRLQIILQHVDNLEEMFNKLEGMFAKLQKRIDNLEAINAHNRDQMDE